MITNSNLKTDKRNRSLKVTQNGQDKAAKYLLYQEGF